MESILLLTGLLDSILGRIKEYPQQLLFTESLLGVSQHTKNLWYIFSFNLSNNFMKVVLACNTRRNRFREVR